MSSVVFQETSNNYTDPKQTIQDRDIVSVIYSPNTPTIVPNRTGMLHVQIPEGATDNQVHVWVSLAKTSNTFEWVALAEGGGEVPATVARTDKENDFQVVTQKLSGKQIMSFIDGGDKNPGDTHAVADYDGQFYIASKVISGKREVAIWVAEGTTWVPLTASVDTTNLAKLDASNVFEQPQKIGAREQRATFISGRRTAFDPTDSASPDFMPYAPGDLLFRSYLVGGATEEQVFFATVEGDAASWIPIYDSQITTTSLAADLALVDARQDVLSEKLDLEIADLDRLASTVGDIDLSITGLEGDIALVGTKVEILEPRVIANESKIAALETHHEAHDLRIDSLEGLSANIPATLEAEKMLIVNAAGTAVTMSTLTHTKMLELAAFAQGAADGNSLLSTKCLGGDTAIRDTNTASSVTSASNFFFGVPKPGETMVATLGDIASYNSTSLSGNKVREGCLQTVVNAGTGILRMAAEGGAKFQGRNGAWPTYTVPSFKTIMLHPQIWDGGEKRYNVIAIFDNN